MKYVLYIFLLASVLAASCKKSENPSNTSTNVTETKITYPAKGEFGINLLGSADSVFKEGTEYSLTAAIPSGMQARIVCCPQPTASLSGFAYEDTKSKGWKVTYSGNRPDTFTFVSDAGISTPDQGVMLLVPDNMTIFYYEGKANALKLVRTRNIRWE